MRSSPWRRQRPPGTSGRGRRDGVGIIRAALTADFGGHEVFNAFASDTYLDVPTREATEAGYGDLPKDCDLWGEESPFSTAKARDVLGWEPTHPWPEVKDEPVARPSFVWARVSPLPDGPVLVLFTCSKNL